ncbi:SMI1/KNR4 family protein [Streptomyces sp. NPDC002132]|uniref:SMI1/KNR4 family protein n=1 Tax=unclassified Streptomyces TaxID=2593676 RepID=UPI0033271CC5
MAGDAVSISVESLLGERQRYRSASTESWRALEEWLGCRLPADYRELVDGFGDAILFGHLFIPHPEGEKKLLDFVQEEREDFHEAYEDVRDIPASLRSVWEHVVPWAYHDWNGDVCLLVPNVARGTWQVAVAFRQGGGFLLIDGGVVEFLSMLVVERRFPQGWPAEDARWRSTVDSPLI